MEFLNIVNENEEEFKVIAEILFNHYLIATKDAKYRLGANANFSNANLLNYSFSINPNE